MRGQWEVWITVLVGEAHAEMIGNDHPESPTQPADGRSSLIAPPRSASHDHHRVTRSLVEVV